MTLLTRLVSFMALTAPLVVGATDLGQTFATPEEAVSALAAATGAKDTNALRVLFGSAAADLQNPDRVQATNDLIEFTTAFNQAQRIVRQSDSKCALYVGETSWPFPIPVAKKDGRWFFDVEAGKDELLNRRIGVGSGSKGQWSTERIGAAREMHAEVVTLTRRPGCSGGEVRRGRGPREWKHLRSLHHAAPAHCHPTTRGIVTRCSNGSTPRARGTGGPR